MSYRSLIVTHMLVPLACLSCAGAVSESSAEPGRYPHWSFCVTALARRYVEKACSACFSREHLVALYVGNHPMDPAGFKATENLSSFFIVT